MKMPNPLVKRAHLTPNRIAITFRDQAYSFQEIYDLSYEMAGRLQGKVAMKDKFIGVLLKNHLDTVIILLSLQLLGAKAVILNNRLTAEEISWQLEDSQAILLITEESLMEKLTEQSTRKLAIPLFTKESVSVSSFVKPNISEEIDLASVCTIMYTSGTTGNPKGVIQTYGNHWWSAVGSALNLGLHEDDCWLCTVPLFHISGYSILMRSIIYGMKIVLHETFTEEKTIAAIKKEHVTIMSVVTTTLARLVDFLKEERLPSSFRCMLLGGGPAPLPLLEKCVEKEIPVYQSYGMTETASQIVTLAPEYSIQKLGSAGKPLFPSQLKIVDCNGSTVLPQEAGEIVVKGPNVTSGYLNEKESRHKEDDGWFRTGDIGYLDEDGFLYVLDRRSDLIISGGENIYPAEIEGILTSHSEIIDAGVIGEKDEKWGQVPVAFIVKKAELTKEEIIEFCQQKLAKYKIPKKMYFVEEIPRNASRKLLRRKLRDLLMTENIQDI